MALIRDVIDRVLFPNKEVHAIPVLDGAYSPNSRLDGAQVLGGAIERPDDLALGADGALYVSSGSRVLRCSGDGFAERTVFAELPGEAGALAATEDGRILVGVSGHGVVALSPLGRPVGLLATAGGAAIHCPTAISVAPDGGIVIADGSRANRPEDWLPDLMQRRPPSGRLIGCTAMLGDARVLADGLDWPGGAAVAPGGSEVIVSESWSHRLVSVPRSGGAPRVLVKNHAGYPGRIAPEAAGGWWMAFFGMRTQLVEFVLREREFCEAMMRKVPRHLWIGPSLDSRNDYREPTQIGRIKKLGIQKPWAPPRSYGLVARLGADGEAIESLHSRVDGQMHGITAVRRIGGRLLAVAKGRDRLIALETT